MRSITFDLVLFLAQIDRNSRNTRVDFIFIFSLFHIICINVCVYMHDMHSVHNQKQERKIFFFFLSAHTHTTVSCSGRRRRSQALRNKPLSLKWREQSSPTKQILPREGDYVSSWRHAKCKQTKLASEFANHFSLQRLSSKTRSILRDGHYGTFLSVQSNPLAKKFTAWIWLHTSKDTYS